MEYQGKCSNNRTWKGRLKSIIILYKKGLLRINQVNLTNALKGIHKKC